MKYNDMRMILVAATMAVLVACGGGSSSSTTGNGGSGNPAPGATPNVGLWELISTLNIIVAGSANTLTHTSIVNVAANGMVTFESTDSICAVSASVIGNTLFYTEQCTFAGQNPAPCILTLSTAAAINQGVSLSGTFGPETLLCSGNGTSYSGNLVGTIPGSTGG